MPGGSAASSALGYRLMTLSGVTGPDAGFALATVGLASAIVLNLILWVALLVSIPIRGVNPLYGTVAMIGVIVMLARHVRQLTLVQAGLTRELGVPPFIADKLASQARRFPPGTLDRALGALAEADRALKGMAPMMKTLGKGLGERVLLDRLVGDLVAMAAPPRRR